MDADALERDDFQRLCKLMRLAMLISIYLVDMIIKVKVYGGFIRCSPAL